MMKNILFINKLYDCLPISSTNRNLLYKHVSIIYNKLFYPEEQTLTIAPAVATRHGGSPPEVTTSHSLAESSSNYLSLKSIATPRDRGKSIGVVDWTSSGEPVADLREGEGEVNGRADGRMDLRCRALCKTKTRCTGRRLFHSVRSTYNLSSLDIAGCTSIDELIGRLYGVGNLNSIDKKNLELKALELEIKDCKEMSILLLTLNSFNCNVDDLLVKINLNTYGKDILFRTLAECRKGIDIAHEILQQLNIPNQNHPSTDPNNSPPEVTTNVPLASTVGPADSSSNYLSLKSNATPGDRGVNPEEHEMSTPKNENIQPGGTKDVNQEERNTINRPQVETSSGTPIADLREAEGKVNKEGSLQEEYNVVTSSVTSSGNDVTSSGPTIGNLYYGGSSLELVMDDYKSMVICMNYLCGYCKFVLDGLMLLDVVYLDYFCGYIKDNINLLTKNHSIDLCIYLLQLQLHNDLIDNVISNFNNKFTLEDVVEILKHTIKYHKIISYLIHL